MFNKERIENVLSIEGTEQPKNLEEANAIIESLKRDFNNLKKISKRTFLLLGGVTILLTAGGKLKNGLEKDNFNQELQNLKTNLEYADLNFRQSELEDNNIKLFGDKTATNILEFTDISEKKKQDAEDYLSKAKSNLDYLQNFIK